MANSRDDLSQERVDFNFLYERYFGRRATVADQSRIFERLFQSMHVEECRALVPSSQAPLDLNLVIPEVQTQIARTTGEKILDTQIEAVFREMGEEGRLAKEAVAEPLKPKRLTFKQVAGIAALALGVTFVAPYGLGSLLPSWRTASLDPEVLPYLEHGIPPVDTIGPLNDVIPVGLVEESVPIPEATVPAVEKKVALETLMTAGEESLISPISRYGNYERWLEGLKGTNLAAYPSPESIDIYRNDAAFDIYTHVADGFIVNAWVLLKGGKDYLVIAKEEVVGNGVRFAHVYSAADTDDIERLLRGARPVVSLFYGVSSIKEVDYGKKWVHVREYTLSNFAFDLVYEKNGKGDTSADYKRALDILKEFRELYSKPME